MAEPDYDALFAIIVANLSPTGVGISCPVWEQICNRVLMLQVDPLDIPRTVTPDDVDGLAATLIAGGVNTPRELEILTNRVTTYPYVRSATDVLDVPTS